MRKYDSYKKSGIEWLDEIPLHWNVERIKAIGSVNGRVGWKALKASEYIDSGYFFLSTPNIKDVEIDFKNVNYITAERYYESPEIILRDGDILLVKDGSTLGIVNVIRDLPAKGTVNSSIAVLRVKKINSIYGYYLLLSNYIQNLIQLKKDGMGVPHLFQKDINNFEFLVPTISEQTAIAQYLDTKTQAIDKKVNLLEKKIGYYKELRKSIINETVTKGLDKSVKLKNSGINYISSIPEHWQLQRIKDIFNIGRGRVIGQEELIEDGLYPVYSSQTENNGCLGYIDTYDFDKDLLTWTTDGANAGTVFRRKGKFNCTNVCGTLIPIRKGLNLDFMVYALQESATHNKRIDTNGAKIMNNEMAVIQVTFPPLSEQTEIATYLDHKTQTIDKIVGNIQKQIITLKELRKTLINDVVTGKIRVFEPAENKVVE